MQGKLGFFFGGLAALCYAWAFFRVPEVCFQPLRTLFRPAVPAPGLLT